MTAEEAMAAVGLHFDDLNKLRVLEPESSQQATELQEECYEFVEKIGDFQKFVESFISITNDLSKDVEKEKMKAIGSRNLLKSIKKQRESEQKQLQALIHEKKNELERLMAEQKSLQKQEVEQTDFIDQFSST